ncbi:MAG: serine/threonine protein kinase, partial [Gammaproteobacteria bacterium]|nr:serine/threonine protein kinase [Gammaproteobacteria bacterium]
MAAHNDIIPDNSARQPQVGSLLGERFLLEEVVAEATIGVVYKASDRTLADAPVDGSRIAVRVLAPELAAQQSELRALQREVARIRCLAHPNIARFIDFNHAGEHYYLAVEWLDGRTLASILNSAEARHIDRVYAFRIARQLAEALDYAHRCGIVHGGIDPAKIMIMPNGDARLFDFGLASFRQRLLADRETSGGAGVGAMSYSSLQVLGGETPVTSDDIFSLACLLYRLIAGYRVFGPRNAAAAAQAGMTPQRPHGFTDLQWIAMSNALSFERKSRYSCVSDFAAALEGGTAARPSGEVEGQSGAAAASKGHRWIVAAVTGMAMLAGITVKTGLVEPKVSPVAAPAPVAVAPAIAPKATAQVPSIIDLPMSSDRPEPVTVRKASATAIPEVVEEPVTKPALPLNAIGFSAD